LGPGSLPSAKSPKRVFGCVVPHAGYQFSGPAAAFSYKALAESKFPSTFIILGPNHTGYGAAVSTLSLDWETPLGSVKADKGFISKLKSKCDFVEEDSSAHLHEHSIEVQLPFLQFVFKDFVKKLKFVPIVIGSHDVDMLKALGDSIASIDKEVCVVASSDFTHYGLGYGYVPFTDKKKERMYDLDNKAITPVLSLNPPGFVSHINKVHATICGYAPILATMFAVKALGSKQGKLLRYYTSGDIVGDYSNSVGYASIVFV
jgi:AmmeMemoRadiSam system protein B